MHTFQDIKSIAELWSEDLEAGILTLLLMEEDPVERVEIVEDLEPFDFFKIFHQSLFKKIKRQSLKTEGRLDTEVIINQFEKEADFENPRELIEDLVGGLFGAVVSDVQIAVKRIKNLSSRRQLLKACHDSQRKLFDFSLNTEQLINNVQSSFLDVKTFSEDDAEKAYVVADEEIDKISEIIQQKKDGTYKEKLIYSGIKGYDLLVGGFLPGTYHILAGRPGTGKTSLATQLSINFSGMGVPCCVFSLEMTKQRFIYKLLSNLSQIDSKRFKSVDMDEKDLTSIFNANARLYDRNLMVDGNSKLNNQTLRSKVKFYSKKYGSKIFFIDYVQNMQTDIYIRDPVERIGLISKEIQAVAKETGAIIFPLAQLNRDLEKRAYENGGKKPIMSDLKGAGQLEQDADSIAFLYRDYLYNPESNPDKVEMILGKNRDGGSGNIELIFKPQFSAFYNKSELF